MPEFAIVDSHLHFWDPRVMRYPWIEGIELLNRPYLPEDYRRSFAGVEVEAMVFLQCDTEPESYLREAQWVGEQAAADPRIKGMVAYAPVEKGRAVEAELEKLSELPLLRGVRRILQGEADPAFCLRPKFIEGVRTLKDFGLSFDICVNHRQMESVLRLAEAVPEVPMVLDHIGKPAIGEGRMEPWASQMRALAQFPHVTCKVSGVATEAGEGWSDDALKPYIEVAFDCFGFERTMFGGDWPVALLAIEPGRWVALLDGMLEGVREEERRRFWRENAVGFYRL